MKSIKYVISCGVALLMASTAIAQDEPKFKMTTEIPPEVPDGW